jgi:hypothetical protein
VREIRDAGDAIEFLEDWPKELRDTASEVALGVCRRAHDRLVPLSAAQKAIEGFAKMSGILEDGGVTKNVLAPSQDNNSVNDCNWLREPSLLTGLRGVRNALEPSRKSARSRLWAKCENCARRHYVGFVDRRGNRYIGYLGALAMAGRNLLVP